MNRWAEWYSRLMGFSRYITFDDKDISTEYSALMSIVMSDESHVVKFPINEPAEGKKKSQIQEYLEAYRGPGVQHVALLCRERDRDRRTAPGERRGVPHRARELLRRAAVARRDDRRTGRPARELGILVDRDEDGYLLQIFTKPVEDRPTVFFEIIQRKGARASARATSRRSSSRSRGSRSEGNL